MILRAEKCSSNDQADSFLEGLFRDSRMKLFTAAIVLFNFASVLHVDSTCTSNCCVCTELWRINAKLGQLPQIEAKLDQINATLNKLVGGGGTSEFSNFIIQI